MELEVAAMPRSFCERLFTTVLNSGLFLRAAITRREFIYWLPGLNAGLPLVPKDDAIHEAEMLEISLGLVAVQATGFFLGWKLRGKSPKSPCEFGQVTFQAHDLAHFLLLGAMQRRSWDQCLQGWARKSGNQQDERIERYTVIYTIYTF